MLPRISVATMTLLLAWTGVSAASADKDDVDVPAAVKASAERILGDDLDYEATNESGTLLYEATTDSEVELLLAPDGTVRETRIDFPAAMLPAAAQQTVRAKAAVSAPLEAEVVLSADAVRLVVEGKAADGTDREWTLDANGALLEDEAAPEDNDSD